MRSIDTGTVLALFRPGRSISSDFDAEADVLYVNFERPSVADDSELTDDDVIVRYRGDDVVGLTILHASQRQGA
ncbi:MAG: DUF2283 domain-containing protein [Dehalococcoidia bacterium]|nr:DUF2283 domain-containing protein [Dehalococcoidia bacterium]